MEEVKKRGRPAKVPANNDKPVAAAGSSDVTTIPKKRGRPAKNSSTVPIKKPSSGRGRGRPPKNAGAAAAKKAAAQSSDDDNDFEDDEANEISSEDNDATNGNDVVEKPTVGRGRPPKAAKVNKSTKALSKGTTSKGRRRTESEERSEDEDADDSEPPSGGRQLKVKKAKKASKGNNDDSNDDEEDDYRPPAVTSAPGRGRPKKHGLPSVTSTAEENGETTATIAAVPKKRGRPSLGKTAAKPPVSAGPAKPRGRPKKIDDSGKEQALKKNDESQDGNQSEEDAGNGSDKDESASEELENDSVALVDDTI